MKRSLFVMLAILAGIIISGCDNPAQIQVKLTSKAMTSFSLLSPVASGTIDQTAHAVAVTVPYGTALTALAPKLTHNGVSVSPASNEAVDFTSPVTYTVRAGDGTSQDYVVTVTESPAPSSDRAITSFGFASPYAVGTINETAHTVAITVPYGTSVTTLTPVMSHTGKSISPASGKRVSFASPVTFTVTADSGATQEYAVTVTVAPNTAKAITSFAFVSPASSGYIDSAAHAVYITVPAGTYSTSLAPSISHTGASISPASGVTVDFTSPVVYTVTAMDGSTQAYTVSVARAPDAPDISPDAASTYQVSVTVSLSCGTAGTDIFYTTDGTTPTKYSAKYSTPFNLVNTGSASITKKVNAIAVKNSLSSAISETTFTIAPNVAPVAHAGANIRVSPATPVTLDGSISGDPNGTAISYNWMFVSVPSGSAVALLNADTATASFTPTVPGAYTLSLSISDGRLSNQDSVTVYVTSAYASLDFTVVDAEYSPVLDSVVIVGTNPSALKVYHVSSGVTDTIALPYDPVAVAVSPDGLKAAVGYSGGDDTCSTDNYVSVIALSPTLALSSTITLDKTLKLDASRKSSNDISSIAMTATHIYIAPKTDQWQCFRCINIGTGVQTVANTSMNVTSYNSIYAGGMLKLRPNSSSVYYGHGNSTTLQIAHWDVSGNVLLEKKEAENSSEYGYCDNLWFFGDGTRLVTSSGYVFTASDTLANDLLPIGWLGGGNTSARIKACNVSTDSQRIATITDDSTLDNRLYVYDATTYVIDQTLELPTFQSGNIDYSGHGAFAFFNAAGTSVIAIEKADEGFSATDAYSLVVY